MGNYVRRMFCFVLSALSMGTQINASEKFNRNAKIRRIEDKKVKSVDHERALNVRGNILKHGGIRHTRRLNRGNFEVVCGDGAVIVVPLVVVIILGTYLLCKNFAGPKTSLEAYKNLVVDPNNNEKLEVYLKLQRAEALSSDVSSDEALKKFNDNPSPVAAYKYLNSLRDQVIREKGDPKYIFSPGDVIDKIVKSSGGDNLLNRLCNCVLTGDVNEGIDDSYVLRGNRVDFSKDLKNIFSSSVSVRDLHAVGSCKRFLGNYLSNCLTEANVWGDMKVEDAVFLNFINDVIISEDLVEMHANLIDPVIKCMEEKYKKNGNWAFSNDYTVDDFKENFIESAVRFDDGEIYGLSCFWFDLKGLATTTVRGLVLSTLGCADLFNFKIVSGSWKTFLYFSCLIRHLGNMKKN